MVLSRSIPRSTPQDLPPCGKLTDRQGACLLLALRHLGDALILCAFIRALKSENPRLTIDVLGRPQCRELVTSFCPVNEYIEVEFPVFGHHQRNLPAIRRAIEAMSRVRRKPYEFSINLIGDVRESLIGRLTNSRWNITPVWTSGHVFKERMTDRCAPWFSNCRIEIPAHLSSYYDSIAFFACALGLPDPSGFRLGRPHDASTRSDPRRVSLHPGASHPSRHWPTSKWKQLMSRLHGRGYELQLLGSRQEGGKLQDEYGDEISSFGVRVVTAGFDDLVGALSNSDILVGMDSLSAHAAFASSIRSVVLNGPSDPRIMTPPGALPLSAGNRCVQFPCNYKYPCRGGAHEYICCREISVDSVLMAVDSIFTDNIS